MYRKIPRYWNDLNNVTLEMTRAINNIGHVPESTKELRKNGYGMLGVATYRHGGMKKVLSQMGYKYEPKRLSAGYWKDGTYIENKWKEARKKIGHDNMTENDLRKSGYFNLLHAIRRKHGGFVRYKESIGIKRESKPVGYWKDIENVKSAWREAVDSIGHEPTQNELSERGYSALLGGITVHHGGLSNFKKMLGLQETRKHRGFWKNWENLKNEMKIPLSDFYDKNKRLPTQRELKGLVGSTAIDAIYNFGSLNEVYERLGYEVLDTQKPKGYWKSWENLKREVGPKVSEFYSKNKKLPSADELEKLTGLLSISTIIYQYHGGVKNVYGKLGYSTDSIKKPNGYWKDWETFKLKIKPLIDEFYSKNRRLPTQNELKSIDGRVDSATKHYGGLGKVYSRLGYLPLSSTESFINFVESDVHLREIMKRIGNDPVTLSDIVSIMYGDRVRRNDLAKFLSERPSLRKYMGRFASGIRDIQDLEQLAKNTLPFDKNNKIKQILIKAGAETVLKQLGLKPSREQVESKLKELELKLHSV